MYFNHSDSLHIKHSLLCVNHSRLQDQPNLPFLSQDVPAVSYEHAEPH